MQTQQAGSKPLSPVVRLENSVKVSRHLLLKVLRLKDKENGAILFNDLVMRCHDEPGGEEMRFVYFDGSISRLGSLGFLQPDGTVYPTVRDIVLSLTS